MGSASFSFIKLNFFTTYLDSIGVRRSSAISSKAVIFNYVWFVFEWNSQVMTDLIKEDIKASFRHGKMSL